MNADSSETSSANEASRAASAKAKVAIGSDHHGLALRSAIIKWLESQGHTAIDVGTHSEESVDYPDIASLVGKKIAPGEVDLGILICGSGIGMSIAVNKFPGVRATAIHNVKMAEMSRRHNNANIICLSDADFDIETNLEFVRIFLSTEFEGGRHQRRVDKISKLEDSK